MKLTECLLQFFDQYLTGLKGASKHTVRTYRWVWGTLVVLLVF